jgi:TolB-like protein
LTLLLERPGQLVSRETVRQELWPAQHVELDQVLAYTVRQVRAALGDEGTESRFVETLPRRGYRFIGRMDPPPATAAAWPTMAPPTRRRRAVQLGAAAALVAILLAVAGLVGRQAASTPPQVTPRVRVAVLPLGEPGLEPANDPLTEAFVVALTARPELSVVGPATTASLRGTTRPHGELGRALGVDFVASGGYRPAQEVLFLQLVRTSDGAHLFARRYRGDAETVRAQLDEAAADLAAAASGGASAEPASQ